MRAYRVSTEAALDCVSRWEIRSYGLSFWSTSSGWNIPSVIVEKQIHCKALADIKVPARVENLN